MVFTVIYDIKNASNLDKFLSKAKELGDVEQYMPYALFIDTQIPLKELYPQLRKVLSDADLIFVGLIRREEINGWLHSTTIDWIKTHMERNL